jgi:Ca-activated chloride channel homolog
LNQALHGTSSSKKEVTVRLIHSAPFALVAAFVFHTLAILSWSVTPHAAHALSTFEPNVRPPEKHMPTERVWRPPVIVFPETLPQRDLRPIEIQSLRVRGDAHGRTAATEIDITFYNPNQRMLEGELQFPLFDGQSIAGFALDVNGSMRDAVPVDKARGQDVFEDVIRGRIDPALLEVTQGNNFKLRVYPLPPRGTRRVLLRLNELLPSVEGQSLYRLPLGFASRAASFELDVRIAGVERAPSIRSRVAAALGRPTENGFTKESFRGSYRLRVSRQDFTSESSLDVLFADGGMPVAESTVFDGKSYFTADLALPVREAPRALPRVVGVVWDSSASGRTRDHAREFQLLDAYFAALRDGEVRLTEIRDVAEPVRSFRIVNGDWSALRRALESTPYDGATNLHAFVPQPGVGEYLFFTDGLTNYGNQMETPFAEPPVPTFAISSAAKSDAAFLRHIAKRGRFIDLSRESSASASRMLLNASTRVVSASARDASSLVRSAELSNGARVQFAGIATSLPTNLRVLLQHPDGKQETIETDIPAPRAESDIQPAMLWAQLRVAELDAEYDLNRAEIRRIGQRFRMVTRETSLIVLDRIEDYARYEIEPPRELRAEYERVLTRMSAQRRNDRHAHLENIVRQFENKTRWWQHRFPKETPFQVEKLPDAKAIGRDGVSVASPVAKPPPPTSAAPAAPMLTEPAAAQGATTQAAPQQATARRNKSDAQEAERDISRASSQSTIRLQRPPSNSENAPYLARLSAARDADLYRVYLDEAPSHAQSIAFFLDAADVFFERGMNTLALRIVSNLAELDLENRHVLRVLGHRLMQASRADLATPVFKRVRELSPNEPQSHRDLGLAYAANNAPQQAIESLHEVVTRPWHNRFPGVELIALAELNAIAAQSRVDTSRIDPRLLRNLPLALRAVLTWDADNTDIDLWVTDPNGERAFFGKPLTYQGGRMSADFTGGYGPEEYSLRDAKPGVYKIEAHYFGDRRQNVAGATTLQVRVTTGFGTKKPQDRIITLRLRDAKQRVYVGEVTVGS